jgi:hypothetical protein
VSTHKQPNKHPPSNTLYSSLMRRLLTRLKIWAKINVLNMTLAMRRKE